MYVNNIDLINGKDLNNSVYEIDNCWNYGDKKFSYNELVKKLNFDPHDLSDFLGLMGDSVDNIPGAPGLGEKTATALMSEYKNLDNIMNSLDSIPSRLGTKYKRFMKIIEENKKIIYLSKKLATLDYIPDIKTNLDMIERKLIKIEKIDSLFKKTGMREGQRNLWIKDIEKLIES